MPWLGKRISGGSIVFFITLKKGVCIWSDDDLAIGGYGENWDMTQFRKFNGEVILKND
ncbi:MAG: hypothetical protein PHT02_14655 [Tissierellia bacterium]|nr:hypothetical protein [Tissierellia bacterium]